MKKFLISISAAFLIVISVAVVLRLLSPEDSWVCEQGAWVKHGNPSAAMPLESCPGGNDDGGASGNGNNSDGSPVIVELIEADAEVQSPLAITGRARGTWFFEASFPVKLLDESGSLLALGIATAQGEWMTEDYVPFQTTLSFNAAADTAGTLVFEKDNPSGLPENAAEVRMPVRIKAGGDLIVKAYFSNNEFDPEVTCVAVFPVDRRIPATVAVGRAALEELLSGPTAEEKAAGYSTSINPGVKIQSLVIENGVASVDFDAEIERAVGGSCRVSAIRAQIEETLKQFPTVDEVVISVNGRTEDILQP